MSSSRSKISLSLSIVFSRVLGAALSLSLSCLGCSQWGAERGALLVVWSVQTPSKGDKRVGAISGCSLQIYRLLNSLYCTR